MVVRIRRPAKGAHFVHPVEAASRTAVLLPGFRQTKLVRVFPEGWTERARRFRPLGLAGSLEQLRAIAAEGWPLEQAVIILSRADTTEPSAEDRELLWSAFGVPVFEQYLDPRNRLLATECDAHAGLHVVRGCEHLDLEHEVCPCGSAVPRLTRGARMEDLAALLA